MIDLGQATQPLERSCGIVPDPFLENVADSTFTLFLIAN
jgi:hypothetical protein